MFLELVATFVAGIACAGIAMVLNRLFGGRLPRWLTPVAAGLGMLAVTVSNEYTWYDRTSGQLPEGLAVALTVEEDSWIRPWTKIWPYTKRFIAVDQDSIRTHDAKPGQRMADLYFFGRWSPVNRAPVVFDCETMRSALLIDGADFGPDGTLNGADWQSVPPDDVVLATTCRD